MPQNQVESVPGVFQDEICNFDMLNMSTRPNRDGKKRLKKFIEERYKNSISNIANFTPDDIESRMYRRARKNPGYSESRSLKFDAWEQHKAMKEAKN